jgi:adenosylcobinamide-GDP ribazoletransferase
MLAAFTEQADRRAAGFILGLLTVLSSVGLGFFTAKRGIMGIILCLLVTLFYRRVIMKRFGGVTVDTTGYYLQIIELTLLAGTLMGGIVLQWL